MILVNHFGTRYSLTSEDRKVAVALLAERANKIQSVKQARAAALRGGVSRVFPKFYPGMSTLIYAKHYYGANGYVYFGKGRTPTDARDSVSEFFEPLSDNPQFFQDDTVVEEAL